MDSWRQRWGRNRVRSFQPNLVYALEWHHHRSLRVQAPASFSLCWTGDEWGTVKDTPSSATTLGIDFVDIPIITAQRAPIRFTFFWPKSNSWEGRDYMVDIKQ